AYLANQGHLVAMLDLDRQKSATAWVAARPDDLPGIVTLDSKKGEDYFTDHLVIDSPAGLHGKNLARTLKLAHKIIVPIAPSMFDQNASRDFLKILLEEKEVRQGKCEIGIVGMRMNARTRAATILEEFLAASNLPILAYLRDTQLYVNAAFEGKSLFDLPHHLSERELEQWEFLLHWLEK
ncbi:MAG: cobyrinic acid a,c-diamide synthase, partial [Gallionellales bacterium RIFOXYB12_FULL_54_9]